MICYSSYLKQEYSRDPVLKISLYMAIDVLHRFGFSNNEIYIEKRRKHCVFPCQVIFWQTWNIGGGDGDVCWILKKILLWKCCYFERGIDPFEASWSKHQSFWDVLNTNIHTTIANQTRLENMDNTLSRCMERVCRGIGIVNFVEHFSTVCKRKFGYLKRSQFN